MRSQRGQEKAEQEAQEMAAAFLRFDASAYAKGEVGRSRQGVFMEGWAAGQGKRWRSDG